MFSSVWRRGSQSPPSGRSRLCRSYTVSMLSGESHREVGGPHEVVLKHLGEGLSEPTIREIKALQELHSVHVIRWVISRRK